MTQVYGASTLKRRRFTKADIEQLENQIMTVAEEDKPVSLRHIFYRMTDPTLPLPVDKKKDYRRVSDRIVKLRRSGRMPYPWIADLSRSGYFTAVYSDAADFVRRTSGLYRADLWQYSYWHCEVWVESKSIAGVILDTCEELAVSLYPASGFTSISFAFSAAENINDVAAGRAIKIFYIGDYDPAGVLIDVSIEKELRKHLDAGIQMDFERIGITPEQIAEYDLPSKPCTDKKQRGIERTVEAEAMPANIMRRLLREKVEALLPARALHVAKINEKSERQHLRNMAQLYEKEIS